jgi:hypothetical protein
MKTEGHGFSHAVKKLIHSLLFSPRAPRRAIVVADLGAAKTERV